MSVRTVRSGLPGAAKKTRTSTGFRPQRPQRCASTNSAMAAHAPTGRRAPLAKGSHPRNRLVGSFPISQSSHNGTPPEEKRRVTNIGANQPAVNCDSVLLELVNAALTGGDDIALPFVASHLRACERWFNDAQSGQPGCCGDSHHHPSRTGCSNTTIVQQFTDRPAIPATRFSADG